MKIAPMDANIFDIQVTPMNVNIFDIQGLCCLTSWLEKHQSPGHIFQSLRPKQELDHSNIR